MAEHPTYRTALVTGASRGIGLALVRRLRAMGMEVHGVASNRENLERAGRETGMHVHAADVTDTGALERLTEGLEVDVLVNNAGYISAVKPLAEHTAEDIDRMLAINLQAPLHMMRLVLPGMIARGRGHIVNITSTAGRHVLPGTPVYGAAKAGLAQAASVCRYDLAGRGVRLTEVAPGRVATDIYFDAFGGDREKVATTLYDDYRTVGPEDVAEAIVGAISMPEHVDVSQIELFPTDQAPGGHAFAKRPGSDQID